MLQFLKIIACLSLTVNVGAYPEYANSIPNGAMVPNPGPQGGVWAGVGHLKAGGGGQLNAFGNDFAAQGFVWTNALCKKDSDGDGRSNGVELGDPNCVWKVGAKPAKPALSHPGVADKPRQEAPVTSCSKYVAPPDEAKLDVVFTEPNVLDKTQTHYRCEQIELAVPAQQTLDKIKTAVILDNKSVLHHMFIYWCPEGSVSNDGNKVGQGPYSCSGNESRCVRVAGFAIGGSEVCSPENIGFRMDFSNKETAIFKIEAHYDNGTGKSQQDKSGISLYFTPTLRPLRGAGLIVGMVHRDLNFELPAKQLSRKLTDICPTALTEMMPHPVYVFAFTPHMHRYGRQLVTEHYRCGVKIGEIGRIDKFEFDNQQTYTIAKPIKILPGDALVTTCTYNTMGSNVTVMGGEESSDEMCFNFMSVYPFLGSDDSPDDFFICASFENGVRSERVEGRATTSRFAMAGKTVNLFVTDFESDPKKNMAACCATPNACGDEFLSDEGGACSIDDDCRGTLMCKGGLCDDPTTVGIPPSPTPAPPPVSRWSKLTKLTKLAIQFYRGRVTPTETEDGDSV